MTRRAATTTLGCCVITVSLVWLIVARDYPMIGHDHRYYVPRLLDTELHVRNNGYVSAQWYTPTFGGGIPAFPNPQHLQYALPQVLTRLVDPWRAILITTALASAAGFFAFRRFLASRLGATATASTLGAVVFVANGFYIEHLIVGHVGYQLFPLLAVVLLALTAATGSFASSGAIIALVLSAMLFHAGTYLLILTALACVLVLLLLTVLRPASVDWRRVSTSAAVALALTGLISAAKLHAVLAFIRQFPREIADTYHVSLLQGLAGLALQLVGAMTMAPVMWLVGVDPARLEGALSKLTGASVRVGIWELDVGLSPAVWIVLAIGAGTLIFNRRLEWPRFDRRQRLALALLVAATWVMIEATLARGVVYPVLKELPILRSLHVNHRVASVFLVPIILIAVMLVDGWRVSAVGRRATAAILGLALLSPLAYLLFPARVHMRSFDVSASIAVYHRIRDGEGFEVTRIVNAGDAEALAMKGSSYRPYEPLFGYDLSAFTPAVVPGEVRQIHEDGFNMTNPVSLVFPRENGLMPFQRIAAGDRDALDAFVTRGATPWRPPAIQSALSLVSLTGLTVTVLLAGFRWRPSGAGVAAR